MREIIARIRSYWLWMIHHDPLDILGQEIAHRAFDQIRFLEHTGGGRLFLDPLLDPVPFLQEQRQIAHEITGLLPFADGADDHAHAFGNRQTAQDLLEALPFLLVLDLARNAALVRVGQQDQVTSGQNQIRSDAWSFGADGTLGHLHDEYRCRAGRGAECPSA